MSREMQREHLLRILIVLFSTNTLTHRGILKESREEPERSFARKRWIRQSETGANTANVAPCPLAPLVSLTHLTYVETTIGVVSNEPSQYVGVTIEIIAKRK